MLVFSIDLKAKKRYNVTYTFWGATGLFKKGFFCYSISSVDADCLVCEHRDHVSDERKNTRSIGLIWILRTI